MWVGFNNGDGSLKTRIVLQNPYSNSSTPYSSSGSYGNTFNGEALNSAGTRVSGPNFFRCTSGTSFLSVPGGGFFVINPLTSGDNASYGFNLEWPDSSQTITFSIPKITKTFTDDSGVTTTLDLEIYQTFDWRGGPETPPYESDVVALQATSSAGLTNFTYTSSDTTVAVVFDGNKLKMLKSATVTITATQAGNSQYNAASAAATITPPLPLLPQTITINAPATISVGAYANFSYSSSAGLPVTVRIFSSSIVEIVGSQLHGLLPGGSVLKFDAAGNTQYQDGTAEIVVIVEGLPQTVTLTTIPSNLKVGDEVTLSATSSAGLAISFTSSDPSVMSVSGTKLKVNRQGLATITATAATSTTYNPASASQDVAIGKGSQSIVFPPIPDIPYGAAGYAVTVSATSGLPVTLTSSNPSVAIVLGNSLSLSIGAVGTTTITATQSGNGYWESATPQQQILRVVKADHGLTFTRPPSLIPLGDRVKLEASTTSGGTVQFFSTGALVIEAGYLVGKSIGTGTVSAVVAGTLTYDAASIAYDVSVGKLNQAITFSEVGVKSFTDFPFRLEASSDSQLPVSLNSINPSIIEITNGNLATIKGTGVVTIEATQAGSSIYNPASTITRQIAVERGSQAIAFDEIAPVAYGIVASFSLKASAPGGAVQFASSNPSVATVVNGTQLVIQGLGVARIIATQAGDSNYFGGSAVQSVIVLPTIAGAVAVQGVKSDPESHSSLTASPVTTAAATSVPAPSIEDRETHIATTASPPLNCGGAVIGLGIRDTESHESVAASPVFSGTAFNMGSIPQGADESAYAVAASSTFSGGSSVVGTPTEVDLADYRAWLTSAATSASSVVAKYDGRNEFEVYFAPVGYEPVGYLKWAASGYILNRRTNEDGAELKGKISI